jgi:hypothetical protein
LIFSHTNDLAASCFAAEGRVWKRFEGYLSEEAPMS